MKACYQISHHPEVEQTLMLLTVDILSCEIPGLTIKSQDKPPSRCIQNSDSGPVYGELKQTLTYMFDNQQTNFSTSEKEFQWAQRDFITYMNEATCW